VVAINVGFGLLQILQINLEPERVVQGSVAKSKAEIVLPILAIAL